MKVPRVKLVQADCPKFPWRGWSINTEQCEVLSPSQPLISHMIRGFNMDMIQQYKASSPISRDIGSIRVVRSTLHSPSTHLKCTHLLPVSWRWHGLTVALASVRICDLLGSPAFCMNYQDYHLSFSKRRIVSKSDFLGMKIDQFSCICWGALNRFTFCLWLCLSRNYLYASP